MWPPFPRAKRRTSADRWQHFRLGRPPVYRDFLAEPDGAGWRLNRSAFEADLIAAARAAGVATLAVGL